MPKLPECDLLAAALRYRCLLYSHNPHLICAVHPYGVDDDNCLDFRLDPNAEPDLEKLLATLRSHHIQP